MLTLTPLEKEALRLSLWISTWAVIAILPPGVFIAWLLARKKFIGKTLLDGLTHLPLVLPPVVIGYLLLVLLGRKGIIGAWIYENLGISFIFNWKGAAVASAVVAFPLLVRAIRLSIEQVDEGLEAAAQNFRGRTASCILHRHHAFHYARYHYRGYFGFRSQSQRIWSYHNFCLQHSRTNQDPASCSLYPDPSPGWRSRGLTFMRDFGDCGVCCVDIVGIQFQVCF